MLLYFKNRIIINLQNKSSIWFSTIIRTRICNIKLPYVAGSHKIIFSVHVVYTNVIVHMKTIHIFYNNTCVYQHYIQSKHLVNAYTAHHITNICILLPWRWYHFTGTFTNMPIYKQSHITNTYQIFMFMKTWFLLNRKSTAKNSRCSWNPLGHSR